jgi:hypothetical protein
MMPNTPPTLPIPSLFWKSAVHAKCGFKQAANRATQILTKRKEQECGGEAEEEYGQTNGLAERGEAEFTNM